MGMFDTYTGNLSLQLKAGDPSLMNYKVGDEVEIPDGVYVASGYDGLVVIHQGKLIATHHSLYTTYGTTIKPDFLEGTTEEEREIVREFREMGSNELRGKRLMKKIERRLKQNQEEAKAFEERMAELNKLHHKTTVSEVKESLKDDAVMMNEDDVERMMKVNKCGHGEEQFDCGMPAQASLRPQEECPGKDIGCCGEPLAGRDPLEERDKPNT